MKQNSGKEGRIYVRCTPEEKAVIKKMADESGETISGYLLKMAFNENGHSLRYLKKHTEVKSGLLKELKRIGVNINQIATRINSVKQTSIQEKEMAKVSELFKLIVELRYILTKGKG